MKEKKNLFFIIDSLAAAGAERSLVTLLNMIDYSEYKVDLQLFSYGGEFEAFLPKEVNLLPPLDYNHFTSQSLIKQITSFNFKYLFSRVETAIRLRAGKNGNKKIATIIWNSTRRCYTPPEKEYDVAIAYAQGTPTFYVADIIKSKQKIAWINADLILTGSIKRFQLKRYVKFDRIVTVSDSAKMSFLKGCPKLENRVSVIYDIINPAFIQKMSMEPLKTTYPKDIPVLVTVSRLCNKSKGCDIALEAAKVLYNRGIKFKWYFIGRGPFRVEMEAFIQRNNLSNTVFLLGVTPNPYPYIKAATLYVQTSRHEGFGLSIAEARILSTPVVVTEFKGVYNQMKPKQNGVVVPINAEHVANAIEDLIKHPEKRESISEYQRTEIIGNPEELKKFLQLIN